MLMMVKGKFHPWMGLLLAVLAVTALVVLMLRQPATQENKAMPVPAATPAASNALSAQGPPSSAVGARGGEISAEELDRFRRNLRGLMLRISYPWIVGARARELFLDGRLREAVEAGERELIARAGDGDRDAAATLLGLRSECDDPESLKSKQATDQWAPVTASMRNIAIDLNPTTRAKAMAFMDLRADEAKVLPTVCPGLSQVDAVDLVEKVRQAAADGHARSLATLAAMTQDQRLRERYLLSASLLSDAPAQLTLARQYQLRPFSDAASKDRGKARFWLEQAAGSLPAASFELGVCLLGDCDGQPANPGRAHQLIESAARQGYAPAMDFMTRNAGDDEASDKYAHYAWLEFRARLADAGCYQYFLSLLETGDEAARNAVRNSFLPGERGTADTRAGELYSLYGAQARAAAGCN